MMNTLNNPTDDQLDAAFAEFVSGWKRVVTPTLSAFDTNGLCFGTYSIPSPIEAFEKDGVILRDAPRFTRSADAVLPWLEKQVFTQIQRYDRKPFWRVMLPKGKCPLATCDRVFTNGPEDGGAP